MSNSLIDLLKSSASRQVMSVDDLNLTLAEVDTKAISELMANLTDEQIEDAAGYSIDGNVATISVRGLLVPNMSYDLSNWGITGYNTIVEYVEAANSDTRVSQIILDIDSGGGFVKGLQGATTAIANSEKPIKTVATGTMGSAAYWLGCTAKSVHATGGENYIGSIGVYIEHFDRSKNLEANGFERQVFRSGFWKGALSNATPLTDRERGRLQSKVDASATVFFEHVAEYRTDLTVDVVKAFEGDTFTATNALKNGLIDSIEALIDIEQGLKGTSNMPKENSTEGDAPKTITQADLDNAVAKATADATAKAKTDIDDATAKASARTKLIFEHANSTDAVRTVLASDAFAPVSDVNLVALLDVLPSTDVSSALNAQAGAGVSTDPAPTTETPDADKAKQEVAKANDKMAKIGTKFI